MSKIWSFSSRTSYFSRKKVYGYLITIRVLWNSMVIRTLLETYARFKDERRREGSTLCEASKKLQRTCIISSSSFAVSNRTHMIQCEQKEMYWRNTKWIADSKEKLGTSSIQKAGKENAQGGQGSRKERPPSTIRWLACLLGLAWSLVSTPWARREKGI